MVEVLFAVLVVLCVLTVGGYAVAVIDGAVGAAFSRAARPNVFLAPLYQCASLWLAPANTTEAPDAWAWRLAPVLYLTFAAMGLALVPWSPNFIPVDLTTGIVLWGALELWSPWQRWPFSSTAGRPIHTFRFLAPIATLLWASHTSL